MVNRKEKSIMASYLIKQYQRYYLIYCRNYGITGELFKIRPADQNREIFSDGCSTNEALDIR